MIKFFLKVLIGLCSIASPVMAQDAVMEGVPTSDGNTIFVSTINQGVGISTNSPQYGLDIASTTNIQKGLYLSGAAGTSGQALVSGGAGSAPTWSNVTNLLPSTNTWSGTNTFLQATNFNGTGYAITAASVTTGPLVTTSTGVVPGVYIHQGYQDGLGLLSGDGGQAWSIAVNGAKSNMLEIGRGATAAAGTPMMRFVPNGHAAWLGGSGAAPTCASCGAGPACAITAGSTDFAGAVTVGAGAATCEVDFGAGFATTPFCVLGLFDNGGVSSLSMGTFSSTKMIFSMGTIRTGQIVNWICFGQ